MIRLSWPLLLYAALALLLWGPWVLDDPNSKILAANDVDPSAYLWFFSWWPHALQSGLNPFYTHEIFVPEGYNLAWVTSMPGPSLLLAPITLTLGPVVTFNVISFAAPAFSAWTAFLLCRHVTGALAPALAGGYLFGFSPYMLGALTGAPQLAFVALVPLLALLVLCHVEGSLPDRWFVVATTLLLTAQIYISTEVLATAGVFGSIALALAYALNPASRAALRRTSAFLGVAAAATLVLAAPLVYYVLFRARTMPEHALFAFPADLASLVVPGELVALAPEHIGIASPSWTTGSSYLGVPLLALVAAFAWSHRASRAARLAVAMFLVAVVAMLGDRLHAAGEELPLPLPWAMAAELPLLRYAIPLRLSLFAFLAGAVVLAMWLAWRPSSLRWALVAGALVLLIPAIGDAAWHTRLAETPFFADGRYTRMLHTEDRVLTVPAFGRNMHWQAQADFLFRMAGGYVGQDPESYRRFALWRALTLPPPSGGERPARPSLRDLKLFIADKRVTAIVAEETLPASFRRLFDGLGVRPKRSGGVLVYRLKPHPDG